jgi:hypothetical protein
MPRKFSGAHACIQLVRAGLCAETAALDVGQCWYLVAEYELGRVLSSADTVIDIAGAPPEDLRREVAGGAA